MWVCNIEAQFGDGTPELLDTEIDYLMEHLAHAAVGSGSLSFSATFNVEADSPAQAATEGLRLWGEAARADAPIVRLEVMTEDQQAIEFDRA